MINYGYEPVMTSRVRRYLISFANRIGDHPLKYLSSDELDLNNITEITKANCRKKLRGDYTSTVAEISEIFVSIQGEGPKLGHPSVFIRLSGCNLNCTWCDTKYASKNPMTMTSKEVVLKAMKLVPSHLWPHYDVVITGGEPMLYPHFIDELCKYMGGNRVTIETNGTIPITILDKDLVDKCIEHIIVSPKLEYIGKVAGYYDSLKTYSRASFELPKDVVYFKYVHDGSNIGDIISNISQLVVNDRRVYLMSMGATRKELLELDPATITLAKQYNLMWSPRAHVYVYNNKRGK